MKEINKIKNVINIFNLEKSLAIVKTGTLVVEKFEITCDFDLFQIRDVLYGQKNNKTFRFDEEKLLFNKISDNIITEFILNEKETLIDEYLSNLTSKVTYLINKKKIWVKEFNYPFVVENSKILLERNAFKTTFFSKINLNDATTEWHFQLPEGFKIFNKIQVVENVLFFKATKGEFFDYQNTYGLDIKTGKILWENNYPKDKAIISFNINPQDNLCYGYGSSHYQVFNPITGEILLDKDMSSYYEQGIDPDIYKNAIYNNKLWFVSGRGDNAKFGSIDLNTHNIDFVQDYPLEKDGQFDKLVCHNGKLYLRDSNNVLHIFEKNQNEAV